MIIVVDSNIWISALVFGGNPRHIFEQTVSRGWRIVTCEEIYTEVRRTLHQKFPEFLPDFHNLVTVLQPYLTTVRLGSQPVAASRDENDDMIIESALIGKARYIITGDKDLLILEKYKTVAILTPQEFLNAHTEHSR